MTDYELLDMIGEVNEDYVLAADSNVVRPRFRWKALAACAACAVLALGAYPAYRAANPPLHNYTLMENSADSVDTVKEWDDLAKAPAGGVQDGPDADEVPPVLTAPTAPEAASGWTDRGGEKGEESAVSGGFDGAKYWVGDAPVQEAALWYDALLQTMRLEENPEWFGGAWIAGDRLLAVAIVDGFRTTELEAEIQEAAGAGAVLQFSTVKYSMEFLNGLMEPTTRALEDTGLCAGVGVDVMDNCLGVDLYSDGAAVPDDILARLAHLDPDGDAIRVRLFTGKLDALTDEAVKGSTSDVPLATPALTKDDAPHPTPVDGDKVYHSEDAPADAVPGGAYAGEPPQAKEEGRQVHYDLLPGDE